MTLAITKGMGGKRHELIGKYTSDEIDKMNVDFYNWKARNKTKYNIAWYERKIMHIDNYSVIIDFGDYSYFALIKMNKHEWKAYLSHKPKPVDLEV